MGNLFLIPPASVPPPDPPPDDENLILQFKRGLGLTMNGSNVISWEDQINGYVATQGTDGLRPIVRASKFSGDYLWFDNKSLTYAGSIPELEGIQKYTIYLVSAGVYNGRTDIGAFSNCSAGGFSYERVSESSTHQIAFGASMLSTNNVADAVCRNGSANPSYSWNYNFGGQVCVRTMVYDGTQATNSTKVNIYANNVAKLMSHVGAGSLPTTTFSGGSCQLTIGARQGILIDGGIFEIRVYNVAHTSQERTAIYDALMTEYNLSGKRVIYCDGDSKMEGTGSVSGLGPIPAQLEDALGYDDFIVYNLGISGQNTFEVESRGTIQYTGNFTTGAIIVCEFGTNDLNDFIAVATIKTRMQTYVQNRVAAGYETLLATMQAATLLVNEPDYDTKRLDLNTNMRDNIISWGGEAVVDWGAPGTLIGDEGDQMTECAYYFEKMGSCGSSTYAVHQNSVGNTYKLGILLDVFQTLGYIP